MEKEEFRKFLGRYFKEKGYRKYKGNYYYREGEDFLVEINPQGSRYGGVYYINYDIYPGKFEYPYEINRWGVVTERTLSAGNRFIFSKETGVSLEYLKFSEEEIRSFFDDNMRQWIDPLFEFGKKYVLEHWNDWDCQPYTTFDAAEERTLEAFAKGESNDIPRLLAVFRSYKTSRKATIEQLEKVLILIEYELEDENSIWTKDQLNGIVRPEMRKLYSHFRMGTEFSDCGKKPEVLRSATLLTENPSLPLERTKLGEEIRKAQDLYDQL